MGGEMDEEWRAERDKQTESTFIQVVLLLLLLDIFLCVLYPPLRWGAFLGGVALIYVYGMLRR